MLDELRIAGLGVIADAGLLLSRGLTVITGETGAGKTMVVTALELLLGARADSALVRAGEDSARIEARLSPPPAAAVTHGWLDPDDDELVVSREVTAGGRSRVRIGGRLAPVSALAEVLGPTVDVHAQGEHVRLARPDVQRQLLDRYAGDRHARLLDRYRDAHRAWAEARDRLGALDADARERARELDRLEHEVREIDAAAIDVDADAALDAELERFEHAELLVGAAAAAAAALGDEGVGEPLGAAVAALRGAAGHDHDLAGLRDRLDGLAAEVADLRGDLRRYAEGLDVDPRRLAELRGRRRALDDLLRKYGADLHEVVAYGEAARDRAEALRAEELDAGELVGRVESLHREVQRLADELRAGRQVAAERLSASVGAHLADLGLGHASFTARVEPVSELTAAGADRVVFELAANPGEPARPLGTAASGGERSRVALAIEVALADVEDAQVLVFDEVDAGVGGATAMAVGEKLARLAAGGRQVLVVTHLAQLAAFADVHHVVEKGIRDGRTVTTTRLVGDDDRPAELARMLSGDASRSTGVDHARELLDEARQRRAG